MSFLIFWALAGGSAQANEQFEKARFADHCLGKAGEAEALYEKALAGEPRLGPKERAEAQFAIGRARAMTGREEAAVAVFAKLAEKSGDATLGSWPGRAIEARDRLTAGENPFLLQKGAVPLSVAATATPLVNVMKDLSARTGASFALDPSCPERWTVSAFLSDLTLDELMDKIVGRDQWRRVGDGIAIGDVAGDGPAWHRAFEWADVKDPETRALGTRICATRVSLTFPGVSLGEALEKLNALKVCEASVPAMYEDRTVRVYAKDLRVDQALDLIAVPIGLRWVPLAGKVILEPRKDPQEDD